MIGPRSKCCFREATIADNALASCSIVQLYVEVALRLDADLSHSSQGKRQVQGKNTAPLTFQ
eukprot:2332114-Amphidinium_carterae.2